MRRLLMVAAFCALAAPTANGACGDLVEDQLSAISDRAAVIAAARKLAQAAALEPRVRAIASRRGANNMDAFEQAYRQTCPEWLSGGKLRNSVLLVLYVDNRTSPQWAGIYGGPPQLEGHYRRVLAERIVPRAQDFRGGDKTAMTTGFVQALNDFTEIMTRPSGSPAPVIVNRTSVNYSWVFITLGLLALIGFATVLFVRRSGDREEASGAQAEASRVRSGLIDRLIHLTDDTEKVVRQAKVDGVRASLAPADQQAADQALEEIERLGKKGLAALSRFDSPDKDDPNRRGLSVLAYRSNQTRYEEVIAAFVEPAEEKIRMIDQLVERAEQSPAAA